MIKSIQKMSVKELLEYHNLVLRSYHREMRPIIQEKIEYTLSNVSAELTKRKIPFSNKNPLFT
jgi:hypothetical protein